MVKGKGDGFYVDPRCPFCGKGDCMEIVAIGEPPHDLKWQLRVSCAGLFSKPFGSKGAARVAWGMRGGREPKKLLKELSVKVEVVGADASTEINGRKVGGAGAKARRRAELGMAADRQNAPSGEVISEAAGVNKTGSKRNRPAPF